ncbi:MAG: hypothetical protein HQL22_00005 [Candidatus Omnitrophica bacterium]|nr:hypothetical protein [Candidatus Omnitrophota bacterium]
MFKRGKASSIKKIVLSVWAAVYLFPVTSYAQEGQDKVVKFSLVCDHLVEGCFQVNGPDNKAVFIETKPLFTTAQLEYVSIYVNNSDLEMYTRFLKEITEKLELLVVQHSKQKIAVVIDGKAVAVSEIKGSILHEGSVISKWNLDKSTVYDLSKEINDLIKLRYKDGIVQRDFPKGVRDEFQMKNGQKEGFYRRWRNNILIFEAKYKNGQFDGEQRVYYADGRLMEDRFIHNGKPEGQARYYDENGSVKEVEVYMDGILLDQAGKPFNGIRKRIVGRGEWCEIPFQNGIADGVSKNFNQNGQVSFERRFVKGEVVAYRNVSVRVNASKGWVPSEEVRDPQPW